MASRGENPMPGPGRAIKSAMEGVCVPMIVTPDLHRRWAISDDHRDRTLHPYTDADTAGIIVRAVSTLVTVRAPMWLGDPGPAISVLVSLAVEADGCLWDAVADARDRGYSWDQIASRLCTSVTTAR